MKKLLQHNFLQNLRFTPALLALILCLASGKSWGQYSITGFGAGNTYTQDFDAFRGTAATLPANWAVSSASYNTVYPILTVGAASPTVANASGNNCYAGRASSSSSDYSILQKQATSGSTTFTFSATNNTGSTINGFVITWNVEQLSAAGRATTVDFKYRLNGGAYVNTGITGTTLYTSSTGSSTAFSYVNSTPTGYSITITGLSLAASGTVDFQFSIANGSGSGSNAHVGIDDFTVYARQSHTVTFNSNGGSGSMSPQTSASSTALTTNTFTYTGFNFAGWNTAADGSGTAYADGATYSFSADMTLYAQWTAATSPVITLSASSLPNFVATSGIASTEQSYTASGVNLTNDISITAPAGFEISTTSGSGFGPSLTLTQSGGTVSTTTIYVRMNSTTLAANSGNISNASTGATTQNVALTGNVLAALPTTQSAITFGAVTANSIEVNFSGGDGAKRILLAKHSSAVNSDPVDATTYTANAAFGSGTQIGTGNYVVYAGTGGNVTVTGLTAGETYYFAVYEYNDGGTPGAENYLTTSPGTGSQATTISVITYTWNGGAGSWATAANWTPTRSTSANTDILQFTDGGTYTITDIPATQTIRQIIVSGNTNVTFTAAAASALTVQGGTGDDLSIAVGSSLNFGGANAITMTLSSGATGVINGEMNFSSTGSNIAHRLIGSDASAVVFNNGAVFTADAGFGGNAFGGSGTTANSVIFSSGATYIYKAGSNPFALTLPASVVVFQSGSLFKAVGSVSSPAFNGRNYANVEIDAGGSAVSVSGSNPVTMDNLTITSGTLNFGMTGATASTIKGNISVASGATLNFAPGSAGNLKLNGTSMQTIGGTGTITANANQNVEIDNASGVTLNTTLPLNADLKLTAGNVFIGNYELTALTVTGGSAAHYIKTTGTGRLKIKNITTTPKTFPVGDGAYNPVIINNGNGRDWSVSAKDGLPVANSGFNNTKAVAVVWDITPSVNPPGAGADITFQFDEASQVAAGFVATTNVQAWHDVAGNWITSGAPVALDLSTPNAAKAAFTGLTAFSRYAISNIDGPLPVFFANVKATQVAAGVRVNWSNLTETDMSSYVVERSADGSNFAAINVISNVLNNGSRADYNFIDRTPFSGVNFYRIKGLERAGGSKYSVTVKVDLRSNGATDLILYPVPAVGGVINYQAVNLPKGNYNLSVYDATGRQVLAKAFVHSGGTISESINLPTGNGLYSLQLSGEHVRMSKTFIVQ